MKKILIVDDEEFIVENLIRIFKKENYNIDVANNGKEAIDKCISQSYDVVLLDLNLPDIDGIEVLKRLKEIDENILVIIITGYASIESAVKAIKLGAYEYIKKPFKADAIKLIVKLALETQILKREVNLLKKGIIDVDIIAESKAMRDILEKINNVALHDEATVLITGESGTGKEIVARTIHSLSRRKKFPFIAINCAALPADLLESELFGHEKGAFTTAIRRKIGLFEQADGGTIFLDEIGDMEIGLQAKLLRFIESKTFRRVGGYNDINVNVRIISATNKNLKELIKEGKFREDLYYRLNVFPIHIPPLRERKEDIIPLVKYFVNIFNKKFNKKIKTINNEVIEKLKEYPWKGNIRELRNIIERICIICNEEKITLSHLPEELRFSFESNRLDFNKIEIPDTGISLEKLEAELNRNLIKKALLKSGNNISKAAKLLKIPRETLRYKIKKFL